MNLGSDSERNQSLVRMYERNKNLKLIVRMEEGFDINRCISKEIIPLSEEERIKFRAATGGR